MRPLTIIQTLEYDDEHQILTAIDATGTNYLCTLYEQKDNGYYYLGVQISESRLLAFTGGQLDLREAYIHPEVDNAIYIVEARNEILTATELLQPSDVKDSMLPETGYYYDSKEVVACAEPMSDMNQLDVPARGKTMLKKIHDTLVQQLQVNLDNQDFNSNPCTNIWIDEKAVSNTYPSIEFIHPSFVLSGKMENVFPEKVPLDVDKEFEPAIAMVLTFSMKENKNELTRFKFRGDFSQFREIKDFGIRFYAMDFGGDINAAVTKCIDILKEVFDCEDAMSMQISTLNGLGDDLCTENISYNEQNGSAAKQSVDIIPKRIVCPHCGSLLTLSKELEKTNYLQCGICKNEFANPFVPIEIGEQKVGNNGFKWGCLVIVIVIILAVFFAPKDYTSGTGGIGDNILITTETLGAIDESAFDELNAVMIARDNIGLLQLMYDGKVENIKSGTHGKVLNRSLDKTRIRLNNGKAYWVNTKFIQSTTE